MSKSELSTLLVSRLAGCILLPNNIFYCTILPRQGTFDSGTVITQQEYEHVKSKQSA